MNFTKFNKNQFEKIEWRIDTKNFPFKKISDLYEEGITKQVCRGFFFSKSKDFGLQPNAILSDCLLNLPTHLKDVVSEVLKDKEAVESIKRGELTLVFRKYDSKYKKDCYTVEFANTEQIEDDVKTF